ncbi:hypothetical protein RhiirC2_826554 [Rhizophagus irregularis]|uniref:Uncharacterized protein n=1 Tax=Rhizophagus irregularis TaxID=588596 RepID=A0A2N1M692_9GLOM|nr:hypothetical protein RhiirC2_826554 [Rhizophagus irregularis]
MVALVPFVPPPSPVFQWTINAARQLIAERRNLHQQFKRIANRHHVNAWIIIANRVFTATGFAATPSPNSFDRACFADMNDEFWLQTDESIDGGMLRMFNVDINIDCEGKEECHDLDLDQKVEIKVEIEDETEVEIEDEVEAGPHIEDKDIKF